MTLRSGRADRFERGESVVRAHRRTVGWTGSRGIPAAPAPRTRWRTGRHVNDRLDGVQPTVIRVLLVESPVVLIWARLVAGCIPGRGLSIVLRPPLRSCRGPCRLLRVPWSPGTGRIPMAAMAIVADVIRLRSVRRRSVGSSRRLGPRRPLAGLISRRGPNWRFARVVDLSSPGRVENLRPISLDESCALRVD